MGLRLTNDIIDSALSRMPRVIVSGKVTRVIGLTVEGSLPDVPIGAACRIRHQNLATTIPAEVVGLKGEHAVLMPVGSTTGIKIGDEIETVSQEVTVRVGDGLLGRVVDGCGIPMDGGPAIGSARDYPLYHPTASPVRRKLVTDPLSLGVRAIDAFLTCGVGQRVAILAGSGVGKSTLLGMMARSSTADVNVIGLIGERGREVREFIEKSLGAEGLKRSVVIVATSDAPALIRMRAAFVATTIAEYFRDKGQKVLLVMDSLTRFAMASREVGLSLGEPPTVKGYTPTLFSLLPRLLERAGTTESTGSITGLYTILTEGDDIQDPVADAVRSIVDGHIVLSRKLATSGHYPPIDILQSLSRVMTHVVTPEHEKAMIQVRRWIAIYEEMEDYVKMGVYTTGKYPELDRAIAKMEAIRKFLQQAVADKTSFQETMAWLASLSREGT